MLYISLIGAALALASCSEPSENLTSVEVTFPDTLQIVSQQVPAPEDCMYMLLDNGWVIKKIPAAEGVFVLNIEDLKHAGMHKLIFINKKKKNMGAKWVYVKPQRPNERLETYLSYPYVRAGSHEKSEIVNLATDIYGNLLEFTPEIQVNFKSQKTAPVTIYNSRYNFNTALFGSRTESGQIPYTLSTEYAYSAPKILYTEANQPNSLMLEADRNNVYADGQSTVELRVKNVKDAYGNICQDGTNVNLRMESNHSTSNINTTIVHGEGRAQIMAPNKSGSIKIKAYQNGKTISNIIVLDFKPIRIQCNIKDTRDRIEIYFNSSNTRQEVEDGTPIKVTFYQGGEEVSANEKSENGKIQIAKAPYNLQAGSYDYSIHILDTTLKGTLKIK